MDTWIGGRVPRSRGCGDARAVGDGFLAPRVSSGTEHTMKRRRRMRSAMLGLCALLPLSCGDGGGVTTPIVPEVGTPLLIEGKMTERFQSLSVRAANQLAFDADVTVNGVKIPYARNGTYQGNLPKAVPAGSPLSLRVVAGGSIVSAAAIVPETPILTSPARNAVFVGGSITFTWTSQTDPDGFELRSSDGWGTVGPSFRAPGSARQLTIDASEFGDWDWGILLVAVNDGSIAGPAEVGSTMQVESGASSTVISVRP